MDSIIKALPFLNAKALTFQALGTLIEVARAGSETSAAEILGKKVQDVSRTITKLENGIGLKLRSHEGKTTTLSKEGQELVTITQLYFASLNQFIDRLTSHPTSVHIGAGDSLIHLIMPYQLSRCHQQGPFKDTVIHISDLGRFALEQSLHNCSIDFGIFREELLPKRRRDPENENDSPLQFIKLGTYKYAVFVSKTLWRNLKTPSLNKLPFAAKRTYWEADPVEMAREKGNSINVRVWCSNLAQVIRLVQEGGYAAVLPTFSKSLLPGSKFKELPASFLSSHTDQVVLAFNSRLLKIKGKVLKPFIDDLSKSLRTTLAGI
jgi:DNA-binding transcriptional LysR family regulator